MGKFYVLVEGVNLYANILDTNQLSVIRGTSFLLKDAIDELSSTFSNQLTPISTGASSGLYLLNAGENAEQLITEIIAFFNNPDKPFSLLSFIVEFCEEETLLKAKEKLLSQLRLRQMRSLIAVPDKTFDDRQTFPDQLEGRRIARKKHLIIQEDKKRYLSDSVYQRWNYGRNKKFKFYLDDKTLALIDIEETEKKTFAEKINNKGFYNDFEKLAKHPNEKHRLNNKLAVIYLDGNSFSKIQRKFIETNENDKKEINQIENQIIFDKTIQSYRANFIYKLLEKLASSDTSNTKNDDKIRLETLLWGGDEMLFVVPAWLGFDLLAFFFDQSKNWNLQGKPLTHAAGIVFCHAKTPIRNIRSLAEALANNIKDKPNGREKNAWDYQVLESIDYPSNNDIDNFNLAFYGKNLKETKPDFIPVNKTYNSPKKQLSHLIQQDAIPKSQLYHLVDSINNSYKTQTTITGKPWSEISNWSQLPTKTTTIDKQEFRLLSVSNEAHLLKQYLPDLAQFFGIDLEKAEERIWLWIYLYELWDYLDIAKKEVEA